MKFQSHVMPRFVFALAVGLMLVIPAGASAQPAQPQSISGTVNDSHYKESVGATVIFTSVLNPSTVVRATTDARGAFNASLALGLWDVYVDAGKFRLHPGLFPVTSCCSSAYWSFKEGQDDGDGQAFVAAAGDPTMGPHAISELSVELATKDTTTPSDSPILLRLGSLGSSVKNMQQMQAYVAVMNRLKFTITLTTAYSLVKIGASEAQRKYETFKAPPLDLLNAGGVTIGVSPNDFFGDSVERVVIVRDGQVIQATNAATAVKATEIENKAGNKRTVKTGEFHFPFSTFAASSPIMIVVIGEHGNFEWVMTIDELKRLR